jgi:C4-dicarboxylate-specific signal transduction histidine kinase
VDVRAAKVQFDGSEALAFSVYDITGFKEGEERRRELSRLARHQEDQLVHSTRLAEMGEMAAGVAHELNQPLTGIKNFARNAYFMLEEGAGGLDEVKENLRLISGQVDRAAKIISQMRELARHTERQFAPVEVNSILRETVEFLTPQMKLSSVDIEVRLVDGLPLVFADRIRLEQVFLNLLTNARQATEDSVERRVYVRTRHEPDTELPVVVEIADTGKGFTPEVAERLFTPFFSTKKARHGTGLGLSISLTIIKDHQGTIVANGAPGKGASFTVRLPAHAGEGIQ